MPGSFPILILVLLALFYFWWASHTKDAPFVPMDADVVERIMKITKVGPNDIFYDLGSGDGRLVIAAAMKEAKATGVEIDKLRVFYSRLWLKILRLSSRAKIINGDIFKTDISGATVVCVFLLQDTNDRIKEKLQKELKPGTRVVSLAFELKGWKVEDIDEGNIYGPIFLYEI